MTATVSQFPPYRAGQASARAGSRAGDIMAITDGAFMATVFLFSSDAFVFLGVHSIVWLLCYAYFLMRLAISLSQLSDALVRNWVFLLYPMLAVVSVLWSQLPVDTLRFGIQLSVSVMMGIFIGSRFRPRQIFLAFFGVMLFAMFVSVLNLTSAITPAYDGRHLFQGIFNSKNALGHRAVLFTATCTFGLFVLPRLGIGLRLACVIGLGLVAIVLAVAGSATGILFSFAASCAGLVLWILLRSRGAWMFLLASCAAVLGLFLIASLFTKLDPLSFLLSLVGRDATLTGRTILWQFGWNHYLMRPWLGFGAAGFWENPHFASDILALQRRYGDGVVGFHDLIVELLVMLGPLGLIAHLSMTAVCLYRTLWHARHGADPYAAWAFIMILSIFGMSLLGAQYYQGHAIPLIFVVALGTAYRLPPSRREAPSARIPSIRPGASLALDIRGHQ
ncbi:O-antigen ligase family protein [Paracoccus limosus]|nr:O-antigen ligase family protein [Paracoccus limosus]